MNIHYCVIVFASLLYASCGARKSRMVCELLDDVVAGETPEVPSSAPSHGPPGKRGAPGPKGDQGAPGPKGDQGVPGVIDRREVNRLDQDISRVDASAKGALTNQNSRILEIEEKYVPRRQLEICDVFYHGKCFALLMSTARMNMGEGRAACRSIQGVPANIYDETHFEKMRALLRSRIYISHNYNHIWTGMTMDIPRRTIRLSDGSAAPYTRWYPNRPYTPARGHVGIHVAGDPNSGSHGMFDDHGTYKLLGVLCEI